MQADITLANEIENALLLAHYSNALTPGASVVVKYGEAGDANEVVVDPDGDLGAAAALTAVFGAGYSDLRLKYDGWDEEIGVAGDRDMMGAVNDSNFTTKEIDSLLSQVQTVVNAARGALAGSTPGEGSVLADSLNKAGITLDENGAIKEEDAGAAANALVFAVADDITKANVDRDTFAENWVNYVGNPDVTEFGYEMDYASKAAVEYAAVLSLAKHIDNKNEGKEGYVPFASKLENYEGSILTNKNNVRLELLDYMEENPEVAADYNYNTDAKAFLAYMNGVTQSSDSLLKNESLYNDNYFGDGTVSSYIKDYVSLGEVLAGVDAEDGVFLFYFNGESVSCLPLDY